MKSIRMRLWSGMMILSAVVILLIFLFQIVFLERFYTEMEISAAGRDVAELVSEIELYGDLREAAVSPDIIEKADQISYDRNMQVQIALSDDGIIYSSQSGGDRMPGMMQSETAKALISALGGEEYRNQTVHNRFGNKIAIMGFPVMSDAGVDGAVLVSFSLASVEDTAEILKKQLVIIALVIMVVSVIISSVLSKKFTEPVRLISEAAEAYSRGELEKRLPDLGEDETGQLARRMNEMGEALTRNEMLKKELISNVSHELRTPLTIIRGYAEAMRDITGDDAEKRGRQLGVIIEQSGRLGNIVEDMLSLSKLQSGTETLRLEPFSVYDILEEIRLMYGANSEKRTFEISGEDCRGREVAGDRRKIEQVLYNFISNAFVHTSPEDSVEVRISENGGFMRIEVADSGPGISEEDIGHVFERYYKGSRDKDSVSSGTGLGLAIVKGILELHKAPYGVESEPGSGAVFWFELPFS